MRILVLSFYYPPDLCAGSFRATSFITALQNKLTTDDVIEVVTTFPNRYHSFKRETVEVEKDGNVLIRRIRILEHRSGFFDQAKAFCHYYFSTLKSLTLPLYSIKVNTPPVVIFFIIIFFKLKNKYFYKNNLFN